MHKILGSARRLFPAFFAVLFVLTLAAQLLPEIASATGGQVTGRSILMSSSSPGATSVSYTVNFTAFTSETHPDVIIDFCNSASDPIPGDTCTATAGTDTPNFTGAAATGWTVTSIDSNHDIKLTTTTLSFTGGSAITPIVITGVTNPTTYNPGTFYGRIMDYTTGNSSTYSSPTSVGSYVDYGGIAMSVTSNIGITSKVYETLTFCVYTTSCATAPALILGGTGGALSTGTAYVNNNTQYTIATNAANGAAVYMTGTTLCRPGGTCVTGANVYTIKAIGTPAVISAIGTEQFGMCVDTQGVTGTLVPIAPYIDAINNCNSGLTTGAYAGSSKFGFNDSASGGGTNNAAGSEIMASTGDIPSYTGSLSFVGNIASTTAAGIYTTSLNLVATGTF